MDSQGQNRNGADWAGLAAGLAVGALAAVGTYQMIKQKKSKSLNWKDVTSACENHLKNLEKLAGELKIA